MILLQNGSDIVDNMITVVIWEALFLATVAQHSWFYPYLFLISHVILKQHPMNIDCVDSV